MANRAAIAQQTPQAAIDATVVRCGCGDPDSHNGARCQHGDGFECDYCPRECPMPRAVESLGTIAYHSKKWLDRIRYRVRRCFHPNSTFWSGR